MEDFQIILALGSAILGLIASFLIALYVLKQKNEWPQAQKISDSIKVGAMAFLKKEYKVLTVFIIAVFFILGMTPIGWPTAIAFVAGAILSVLAGNIGMRIATAANGRTAAAVKKDIYSGLKVAFSSGSVMGLSVVSLGLIGIGFLYLVFQDPQLIYGFGFGASSIALFTRVGGGIYTKAADVGADLVSKIEKNIPEDDPRNPATIADNVGDNVGDVAGMGADLFESYVDSIIAAMILGVVTVSTASHFSAAVSPITLPLAIAGLGILASLVGILVIKLSRSGQPQAILNRGILSAGAVMTVVTFIYTYYWVKNLDVFYVVLTGLLSGIVIGLITEYYTSGRYKPTQEVSRASETGSATNIIAGLANGMQSVVVPVLIICGAILISYYFLGLYGVALAAVGMLSTLGIALAADTYGPVVDNAAGIAEMASMGAETRQRAEELDAVGNTTAAIGKGFAVGSAALTALVLSVSYSRIVGLKFLNLNDPLVLVGLLIGGLLPFVFSALTMKAVGRAAYEVVQEVRRQFNEIKGLIKGEASPDYVKCVDIVTGSALRQMILPGLMAVLVPVLIGWLFGPEALGGLLMGAILTGFLLAIMMANAGGTWDNAKKYIEADNFGGKGSEAHKAAVVGDTVGDPLKDTAGPSLNILIKLMAIVALIIAPLL